MNFASYDAFRTSLHWLIEGEERTGTFTSNTLDLMIGLGETRVHDGDAMSPGLRASSMIVRFADMDTPAEVASGVLALPADLLELREVYFSGEQPLDIVPLDRLRRLADAAPSGTTRYAAQDGDQLQFWPAASDGPVLGSYYARPEALKGRVGDDWTAATTFARYPQLYLYAALYEAALFLGHKKAPEWEKRYRELASGAQASEQARVYGGGTLRVRTR